MPFKTKAELALEKLLKAESDVQAYARSGRDNPEQQKQLADAVERAINEFIAQVARSGRKGLKTRAGTQPPSLAS